MNQMVLKGKWHQTKGALQEKWGRLTDDDIEVLLGTGEQLAGRLQERYGYSRERAEREVAEFMDSFKEEVPLAEVRDKSVKAVREHPWFTGLFFGSMALLLAGYILNRFFTFEEIQQEVKRQIA